MKIESLIGHLMELYTLAMTAQEPLDRVVAHFYRDRRYLGSRDRAWLNTQFWQLARWRVRWLKLTEEALAEISFCHPDAVHGDVLPEAAMHVALCHGWFATAEVSDPEESDWSEAIACAADRLGVGPIAPDFVHSMIQWSYRRAGDVASLTDEALPSDHATPEIRFGWPEWLAAQLRRTLDSFKGWTDFATTIDAFMHPASPTLRVNTIKTTREAVLAQCAIDLIGAEPAEVSPDGIILLRRTDLSRHELFRQGHFEMQDTGSQMIAAAAGAQPGWRVLDACAGGGGKTLHLAALMENRGEIVATDIARQRLKQLEERALRAGVGIITIEPPDYAPEPASFNAVLIDAPCSGVGTIRRQPEMLWRTTPEDVARRAATQRALLEKHAAAVKPGGVLVYATCSFLVDENDEIVTAFLASHPEFHTDRPLEVWRAWHRSADSNPPDVLELGRTRMGQQLLPAFHGSDAFFISVLRRTSA